MTTAADLPAAFKFSPRVFFTWDGVAEYHPGMSYNCTPTPLHNALREKCATWLDEGKIEIVAVAGFRIVTTQTTA